LKVAPSWPRPCPGLAPQAVPPISLLAIARVCPAGSAFLWHPDFGIRLNLPPQLQHKHQASFFNFKSLLLPKTSGHRDKLLLNCFFFFLLDSEDPQDKAKIFSCLFPLRILKFHLNLS
jgi:hypothetical protein